MDKTEYMNALKQALDGLPAEAIEETMWAYERKFTDAMAAGRSEQEIAAGLPKPGLVAAQKSAGLRYQEVKKNFSAGNIAGLFVSVIGLLVFNLFMIIPATVYFCLLFATYVSALVFYMVGIGITAASLSGVSQFNFDIPVQRHVMISDAGVDLRRGRAGSVSVDISPSGIVVDDDDSAATLPSGEAATEQAAGKAMAVASASASAAATAPASAAAAGHLGDQAKIHVNVGNRVQGRHAWEGVGLLLGGIALFLFCLFMTRYTFIGFKHYLQWNVSLLKLPVTARAA
ncbi:DUF1700 domain-containing protein [Undibacterium sp.]|jgi:uncharacterized membrane protein|uniref:DUF1700 domain-containing protein n=1 Tax=Undibacterium sp. TaxID=1914977 RepID=UPI002B8CA57C|nr:DUF1700 domain-containing protein [Undibacterium sp.]HTD02170.1 DUF1700 domain-containing protein [Undibacterium sp.]